MTPEIKALIHDYVTTGKISPILRTLADEVAYRGLTNGLLNLAMVGVFGLLLMYLLRSDVVKQELGKGNPLTIFVIFVLSLGTIGFTLGVFAQFNIAVSPLLTLVEQCK